MAKEFSFEEALGAPVKATEFSFEEAIGTKPAPEQTFTERAGRALTRGISELGESASGIALGGKAAFGMKEAAGAQAEQIRKEAAAQAGEPAPISWDELEKTYGKEGAIAALKKMPSYLAEQILQSAPSMAVPLAAGAAAGAVSGPLAPIVAPIAGIGTYGLQQFGQFMQRQAQEGATGETLAPGKAAAAAAVTAPIGYFADKLTLGFGKIPEKILGEQVAKELARRTSGNIAARTATGATVGVIAEAPTEVLEQVAERYQAGLPLTGDEAKREYKEAFFGAAAVGGVGGAASRAISKAPVAEVPRPSEELPPVTTPVTPAPVEEHAAVQAEMEKINAERQAKQEEAIAKATPLTEAEGYNVLRGAEDRNAPLMAALEDRRLAEEEQQAKEAETTAKVEEEKTKDVESRVNAILNPLLETARITQLENKTEVEGAVNEMYKDFKALYDQEQSTPLTPEQTTELKQTIRARLEGAEPTEMPAFAQTPFKTFLMANGISSADAQDVFGDKAVQANRLLPGVVRGPNARRGEGLRLDMLAEKAKEAGFLSEDQDTNELVDKIKQEFTGEEQLPVDMEGDRAAAMTAQRATEELQSKAVELGIDTKGMDDAQVISAISRIERRRQPAIEQIEARKRRYERDIEGFAQLAPEEKNRIASTMADQFGVIEPAQLESGAFQSLQVFEWFKKLGNARGNARQGVSDAVSMMNVAFHGRVISDSSLNATTVAAVDTKTGNIHFNPLFKLTREQWAQVMAEEVMHSVDLVGEHMAMSASSERLKMGSGDIATEAQSVFDSERGIADYLSYPLSNVYKFSDARKQAELFARLAVLYHGDPARMQRELPTSYKAYHDLFGTTILSPESRLLRNVPAGPAGGVEVSRAEREGAGANGRPVPSNQAQRADLRLGAIRQSTANIFAAKPTGEVTREARFEQKIKAAAPITASGQQSEDIMHALGRVPEVSLTAKEKFLNTYQGAMNDPKGTAASAKQTFTKFMDKLETFTFSSDAALNNQIKREITETMKTDADMIGALLETSLSQTVHSNAISSLFLELGDISYNKEIHKWEGKKSDATFKELSNILDRISDKTGLTKERVEQMAHLAFEAKRLQSVEKFNAKVEAEVADMRAEAADLRREGKPVAASALSDKASHRLSDMKTVHMESSQISAAMELFKIHPELNEVVQKWNDIRANSAKVMIESGLWSEQEAEELLSNMDYVPFYREQDNIEGDNNFKARTRSLMVSAKDKKFKGSQKPVNDIFENQIKWVEFAINRAVRNRSAVALAKAAEESNLAQKVENGKDAVRVWENGQEVFYKMDDPMYMEAFKGLEGVAIPTIKWAAKMTTILRNSVVMYPLFSLSQIPQDSIAAIFSSGLKPQYALKIPVLAVKEFVKTLGRQSATHNILKNVGAVGVRDFNSQTVRNDIAILSELKGKPGFFKQVMNGLNHFSMAADNAVRQATFIAAEQQGLSRGEAMEKAFEVFNARRKGSSKMLNMAGQVIPFFPAYLAAQHVAYKVLTGRGISPQQRKDAYQTLAATTGSVMALSLLYAMMNGDDEDYLKKTTTMRDRVFVIPGTGGLTIPMRPDVFAFPKIITEHMYLMMTDKGFEDGRKFRDSMTSALGTAILGPTPVPQAVKPLIEVALNHDFFQGRPLVGTYQKALETERQFTESTSELGKWIGSSGIVSPIAADHLIRGMFGSVGGLVMFATNPMMNSDPDVPRPSLSIEEAFAALPGTSGFVTKEYDNALKKDFYVLKEEVDKAAKTMKDIEQRSPHKLKEAYSDKELVIRSEMQKDVAAMSKELASIHREIAVVTNSTMPADQKSAQIRMLNEMEGKMLKSMGIKQMRKMANL